VKLPFGLHKVTQHRCYFLDDYGEPITSLSESLTRIHVYDENDVDKAIEKCRTVHSLNSSAVTSQMKQQVDAVFSGCNILRYLQEKAEREKRLVHMDRITLVSVLGHMGEAGRIKLHEIINHTLNYDFRITDKWYQRTRGFPVSCPKIRLWQESIIAAVGCYCKFKERPNSYPSPVLYADKDFIVKKRKSETIQVPAKKVKSEPEVKSRDKTKPKSKNDNPKNEKPASTQPKPQIESFVRQYLKLLQQKRKIDDTIKTLETQLDETANEMGVDMLQTAIGTLRRIKIEKGTKWVLEL
jgi:hypothetical protein